MTHPAFGFRFLLSLILGASTLTGITFPSLAEDSVTVQEKENSLSLANKFVILSFDFAKRSYSITDAVTHDVVVADAWMAADGWGSGHKEIPHDGWTKAKITHTHEAVSDDFGKGMRVLIAAEDSRPSLPVYLFSYTLHENQSAVVMGFGARNSRDYGLRLMTPEPMVRARFMPGKTLSAAQTLNGGAGAESTRVKSGATRESANSLMLTGQVDGKRRTIVWGGLANKEFGKYAAIHDGILDMKGQDPVGRLIDPGQNYQSEDTFYLDAVTDDPFVALERYGRAMRTANHAHPNVYDFPVLCGWGVGALSHLPSVNNSKALVEELETAQKCGLTKYTKVGIRLEPDSYCYGDGNTEQGWWDDAHWAKHGHLVPPYETFAKWCAAIREHDGIPYTYFQMGMPSDDYARAFPGHMLFNDISRLQIKHPHHQPLVSYDYTDPEFQKRTLAMWQRLRQEGMRGIKFDYPESAWRPEGGFENPHATTAFAYREAFRLAREGLSDEAFLDERNLGESGRPCLDVTAGLVDTQRNWGDSNAFVPGMVTIGGLRWYKNRTVFNYYPDSKTVHGCSAEIRQSMLTMVYLTSGRIDLATSFKLFTPEIVHDFSRIYPAYREPFTARPLDAFTGVNDPQVYDLELTPEWHQVALFNAGAKPGTVSVALSGDRASTGAIGLDPAASYYVYEFWTDTLIGKIAGSGKVERQLTPLQCAMLSIRKAQAVPQVLSTNRHVLQGWVELADVKWDATAKRLSGKARVIGGEPFRIALANNGRKTLRTAATGAQARVEAHAAGADYSTLILERADNGEVTWQVEYEQE